MSDNKAERTNEIPASMCKRIVRPTIEGDIKIVYKHNKPYGIRDNTGFLFFFAHITKYSGQENRYRQEIENQFALADYLLDLIKAA